MKSRIVLASALTCTVVLTFDHSYVSAQQSDKQVAFAKRVEVFGLYIYATNTTADK